MILLSGGGVITPAKEAEGLFNAPQHSPKHPTVWGAEKGHLNTWGCIKRTVGVSSIDALIDLLPALAWAG